MTNEKTIYEAALHCGYENCGILPIDDIAGYAEKLTDRMERVPESSKFYARYHKFAALKETYPWARAIVVCTFWKGMYRIPAQLKGFYAKHYLTDGRQDAESEEYNARLKFNDALTALGIQHIDEPKYGITGLRYAAATAGLGRIRKNNFFYTAKGSYVSLAAWLIDRDLSLQHTCDLPPCADTCKLCQNACKACSLTAPFTMNPLRCTSYLNTFGRGALPDGMEEAQLKTWVYGCDDCQDVCPFNRKALTEERPFPGLDELAETLVPETLSTADDQTLLERVQPKLWYIPQEAIAQFRENAKRAMRHKT